MARIVPASFVWCGGGGNNNASTGGNWVGGIAPSAATDSIQLPGFQNGILPNGNQPIVIDADFIPTITNLDIQSGYGGTVEIEDSLTVAGTVTQAGSELSVSGGETLTAHSYQITGGEIAGSGTLDITGERPRQHHLQRAESRGSRGAYR